MNAREEKARALFEQGFNCAQAVFVSFCDEMGIDTDTALRLSSSFGGGMGRLREVCGAVSGMFMAAGALCGYADEKDGEAKKAHYALIQELARKFRDENGSIVCRELLGLTRNETGGEPSERSGEFYRKRPCVEYVGLCARLTDELIAERRTREQ